LWNSHSANVKALNLGGSSKEACLHCANETLVEIKNESIKDIKRRDLIFSQNLAIKENIQEVIEKRRKAEVK
jgi:hypothetical protein